MYYIIQENLFQQNHYTELLGVMKKFDLPYQVVKLIPFTREIEFIKPVETNNVFCFGAVKMAHIAKDYHWTPGSFYNENHDYEVYAQHYQENLLNWDSKVYSFGEKFDPPSSLFFVRPTADTKVFTGQVFMKHSWEEFATHHLTNSNSPINENTRIQVSTEKDIEKEVRVWVIGGKIATASLYRMNNKTMYEECTEPYFLDFANEMIAIYQPAEAFVMDIAKTSAGLRIVEINCINCAGFYKSNLQEMIGRLEECFHQEEGKFNADQPAKR